MKFVIVTTRQKYGGAIVLHTLCKCLTEQGYDASVFYVAGNYYSRRKRIRFWVRHILFAVIDFWKAYLVKRNGEEKYLNKTAFEGYVNVAVKGCRQKFWPRVGKDTVVVYPDIVHGNFMGAKHVVRWLLYYNRYHDKEAYGKGDLFVAYREVFNDETLNPEKRILSLVHFDLDLYRQTNFGPREGRCYIVRKGKSRKDLPEKFDGPVIDSLPEQEKVRVFNRCEYCISYDTQTSYSEIAALCGCISVVIPEEGKSWRDYRLSDEERYGQAFGFAEEELNWAQKTRDKIKGRYVRMNKEGIFAAQNFVKLCRDYFYLVGKGEII